MTTEQLREEGWEHLDSRYDRCYQKGNYIMIFPEPYPGADEEHIDIWIKDPSQYELKKGTLKFYAYEGMCKGVEDLRKIEEEYL